MPGATSININSRQPLRATGDSLAVRAFLIGATLVFFLLFLFFPLVVVFQEAFSKGGAAFLETFRDPYTRHSIVLTLVIAAISVPLNTVFGIAAAW
jgi:sulfate transport system permease protein